MKHRPSRPAAVITAFAAAGALALVGAAPASATHPGNRPAAGVRAAANPAPPVARRQIQRLVDSRLAAARDDGDGGDEDGGREAGDGPDEVADRAQQYSFERTAPGLSVPAAAIPAARAAAAALPGVGGAWRELTHQPYDAAPAGYTDPEWSNDGSGFGLVGGRMTALAVDGTTTYAGAADGGLWRTTDGGAHWTALGADLPSLSTGALLVGPSHSVWLGTGEANTNADAYSGQGVWVSTDRGTTLRKVGGAALDGAEIYRLVDDHAGHVYAATTRGLFRMSSNGTGSWARILAPAAGTGPYANHVTDVVVRPGTNGRTVLAVLGWRSGAPENGFYLSTTGGGAGSFARIVPNGSDGPAQDIGRTTLAYSPSGDALYALVESPAKLAAGEATNLRGLYVIRGGDPRGRYTKLADSDSLSASGSALEGMPGYHVGVQSWYNQALAVDPADPQRIYVSLEEVFQSDDGGKTFHTASPYWNYGLACGTSCPDTTHPDQHALAVSNGQVWIGNDGGVYRRPTSRVGYGGWTDTNATLHTTQYYGVGAGALTRGATAYWGGLQDNGTSALFGSDAPTMVEPAGGDGGNVLVDPVDGTNAVGEYTGLFMYLTTDGGRSFRDIPPPDSGLGLARFIAPFTADVNDPDHWVAGGQRVWDDTAAWQTVCDRDRCDWKAAHDLGTTDFGAVEGVPNLASAIAVNGTTTYAAWVAGGNPPTIASGIDTNAGGTWHRLDTSGLPNRYIAGLAVDPQDANHVYAVYNGFSRRWIDGAGTGHVFESRDAGAHWSDVSGNLPDIGGTDAVIGTRADGSRGIVVSTDAGVYAARLDRPGSWYRVGSGLPNVSVNDLTLEPDGRTILAGTHGRGMWTITAP